MSAEREYELFSDPRRVVEDGRIAKAKNQQRLAAIFAPPEPEPSDADAALDELVDAVAERIVERVQAVEVEPTPEGRAAGRGSTEAPGPAGRRRRESHDEWLTRVLRERRADRGAAF
jgi:hypothetical protein